ncbi:MAG: hypothetical protein ABIG28_01985 [archaeon]
MKTLRDFSNKLLKRRELEVTFVEDRNPGLERAKEKIVKEFKADESLVVVKSLKNNFGNNEFKVNVFIYEDSESKEKIEPKKKEKKKGGES